MVIDMGTKRALGIDGDLEVCRFVSGILKEAGFAADVANDSKAALELVKRKSYCASIL